MLIKASKLLYKLFYKYFDNYFNIVGFLYILFELCIKSFLRRDPSVSPDHPKGSKKSKSLRKEMYKIKSNNMNKAKVSHDLTDYQNLGDDFTNDENNNNNIIGVYKKTNFSQKKLFVNNNHTILDILSNKKKIIKFLYIY